MALGLGIEEDLYFGRIQDNRKHLVIGIAPMAMIDPGTFRTMLIEIDVTLKVFEKERVSLPGDTVSCRRSTTARTMSSSSATVSYNGSSKTGD